MTMKSLGRPGIGVAAALVVVVAAATPGTASESGVGSSVARSARPDLVVSAVSTAHSVVAGSAVTVSDTTRNSGRGRAAASYTGYWLSRDKTWSKSDLLLSARKLGGLRPGRASSG